MNLVFFKIELANCPINHPISNWIKITYKLFAKLFNLIILFYINIFPQNMIIFLKHFLSMKWFKQKQKIYNVLLGFCDD
jgi:hypothetical protein